MSFYCRTDESFLVFSLALFFTLSFPQSHQSSIIGEMPQSYDKLMLPSLQPSGWDLLVTGKTQLLAL